MYVCCTDNECTDCVSCDTFLVLVLLHGVAHIRYNCVYEVQATKCRYIHIVRGNERSIGPSARMQAGFRFC